MLSLAPAPTILGQHSDAVKFACFSPDGRFVAAADADRNIAVWSTEARDNILEGLIWQGSLRHWSDRFRAMDHVRSMAFWDESTLVVASGETLRAIDVQTGKQVWYRDAVPEHAFMIVTPLSLAVGPRGQMACSYADGLIEMYDAGATSPRWVILDNDGPIKLQFTGDGKRIVGTDRFSVCAWDVETGEKTLKFQPGEKTFGFSASPRADAIVVRSLFHARVYELDSRRMRAENPTRAGFPNVECSNRGEFYASVDAWGVSLIDFDGVEFQRLDTEFRPIGVTFSPRGDLGVTSLDGAIRLYVLTDSQPTS